MSVDGLKLEDEMRINVNALTIDEPVSDPRAIAFCEHFLSGGVPRYVFGCNAWGKSIADAIHIDGFVDDFSNDELFCGRKVIRSCDLPVNAFVVSAVVLGRPLTALAKMNEIGVAVIDYFSFKKYSGLPLRVVDYFHGCAEDIFSNRERYDSVFSRLSDHESRHVFSKIINFRVSEDIHWMSGFSDEQYRQYFENFLCLNRSGEVFIDVGSYDGSTAKEFIARCENYKAVHVFEPILLNMERVRKKLSSYDRVSYYECAASDKEGVICFTSDGASSMCCDEGDMKVKGARIDELINEPCTFIKMDVEGSEVAAIRGASKTILDHHPRLAISVYHRADDFWRIPDVVFAIRDDYDLFLRHYTEGVVETVMFFMPRVS